MEPAIATSPVEHTRPAARTMQAAVLAAAGQIEIRDTEIPRPAGDEVRIRLEGCGVCASNLEVWAGQPWFEYPLEPGAPGHEGWGVIDEIGESVSDLEIGDRVAFLSGHAYAEYDVTPASSAVKLPSELDGRPFPAEPLACAMNIFRRSEIRSGQTVAIVGIGFLGALLTQLATNAGANVIAISRRQYALDVATRFGASATIRYKDNAEIVERVTALTDSKLCERVIEAVGSQQPLDLAGEICGEGGRLIIAGYHQDGPRQVNMWLWNWRGLDVINAHERDPKKYVEGMRSAVEAVRTGTIDPYPLFTHVYPLQDLDAALDAARDRPDGFLKAVISL